jgi:hypothetical protein
MYIQVDEKYQKFTQKTFPGTRPWKIRLVASTISYIIISLFTIQFHSYQLLVLSLIIVALAFLALSLLFWPMPDGKGFLRRREVNTTTEIFKYVDIDQMIIYL